MSRGKNPPSPKAIEEFLRKTLKAPPPVLFLYGEEEFLIQDTAKRYLKGLCGAEWRGEVQVFDDTDFELRTVLDELRMASLFASRQVVWLQEPRFLEANRGKDKKAALAVALETGFAGENRLLITSSRKVDGRDKLIASLKKKGLAFPGFNPYDVGKPGADQAEAFVKEHLARDGKEIAAPAFKLLRENVPNDLFSVLRAAEVLVAYVGERKQIERADVEVCVPKTSADLVYELTGDIAAGNRRGALLKLRDLVSRKNDPVYIHIMITREFRALVAAYLLRKGALRGRIATDNYFSFKKCLGDVREGIETAPRGIALALGAKRDFPLYLTFQKCANYNPRRLNECILELAAIDKTLKTTAADGAPLLELFINKVCG